MPVNDRAAAQDVAPLWRLAFRAGFLLAAAFAVVGMSRWLYWMISPASWDYSIAPTTPTKWYLVSPCR